MRDALVQLDDRFYELEQKEADHDRMKNTLNEIKRTLPNEVKP